MFKKVNRLAKAKDINLTFVRGRTFFTPFFTLKYLSSKTSELKINVVVSTKVFKKANKRNRLKRIAREFLKNKMSFLKPGMYMVIAKPKISSVLEDKYKLLLEELFLKIR